MDAKIESEDPFLFKKYFIYLFLERWEGKEKERERNTDVLEKHWLVASQTPPTRDVAHNWGICPDWESDQQHFGLQDEAQLTEPHQSGQDPCSYCYHLYAKH